VPSGPLAARRIAARGQHINGLAFLLFADRWFSNLDDLLWFASWAGFSPPLDGLHFTEGDT